MSGITMEEKLEIVKSLSRGEPVWRVSDRMRIRPRTIRKWYQRFNDRGRAGLETKLGRPSTGGSSSFTPEIREALLYYRRKNPGLAPMNHHVFLSVSVSARISMKKLYSK